MTTDAPDANGTGEVAQAVAAILDDNARRLASSANHDREHLPQIIEWRRNAGI